MKSVSVPSEPYTLMDWHRDKVLSPVIGQVVEDAVISRLREEAPPTYDRFGLFQAAGAVAHNRILDMDLYLTFKRGSAGWVFCGKSYYGLEPLN